MSKFELNIADDIESTAWIESDPFNNNQTANIILHVDWETEEAEIRTEYNTNGMDYRTFMHLASEWRLPDDVDARTFKNYYNDKIRPIILRMVEKFEVYWDGSNHRGRFVSGVKDVDGYDIYSPFEDELEISGLILDAWRHDYHVFFDVGELFQAYEDIIDDLKYDNIDFMTVDLDDDATIQKIRNALEEEEIVYVMSDVQFANELKAIREEIIEEREDE